MTAVRVLRRLRTMSGVELRTRLFDAAYSAFERRMISRSSGKTGRRYGQAAVTPAIPGQTIRSRFLPSVSDLDRTRRALQQRYADNTRRTLAHADALVNGEITLFGRPLRFDGEPDWHADPISGQRWPLVYHGDVPVGDRSRAPGDAKDVWELNRHQYLVDLAKSSLLTGQPAYARGAVRLVRSWIAANPYGVGVNWSGPLEVAYRALAWLWMRCLIDDERLSADDQDLWLNAFNDHGRFLHRHLEWYESPYNHLISEAAILYVLGAVFEEFPEAIHWRERARHVLERRLPEQFYADGGSVEQATVYHHATLAFYLISALVARRRQEDLAPDVWTAIERALEFSQALLQPDGRHPAIGDNDDARPLTFDVRDNWDFRYLLAAGAAIFRRRDFKAAAGTASEDAFWLVGPDGLEDFDALADAPTRARSVALPRSGYAILRGGPDRPGDYVCFDSGEQGGGLRRDDIPSAAHGHADALSVIVSLGGRPILVDPGFFTYDGDRAWERFFRETAAHNTIRIDGRDQATHLEKMAWCHVPEVRLERFTTGKRGSSVTGSHDGYCRFDPPVHHRRTVWLRAQGYVIVLDELTGRGAHEAEVVFQFHESLDPRLGATGLGDDHFSMEWSATTAVAARLTRGADGPDGGWVAPRLGSTSPAARLVLSLSFVNGARVLTTLIDTSDNRLTGAGNPGTGALVHTISSTAATEIIAAAPEPRMPVALTGPDGLALRSTSDLVVWRNDPSGLQADELESVDTAGGSR